MSAPACTVKREQTTNSVRKHATHGHPAHTLKFMPYTPAKVNAICKEKENERKIDS